MLSQLGNHPTLAAVAFTAEVEADALHRLIQPVDVVGLNVNEVLVKSAMSLMEQGNLAGFQAMMLLIKQSNEIEVLTQRGLRSR